MRVNETLKIQYLIIEVIFNIPNVKKYQSYIFYIFCYKKNTINIYLISFFLHPLKIVDELNIKFFTRLENIFFNYIFNIFIVTYLS